MSDIEQPKNDNQQQIESLLSQMDAHRTMLNEYINNAIILRTSISLLEKQNKALIEKSKAQEAQINVLHHQLSEVNQASVEV